MGPILQAMTAWFFGAFTRLFTLVVNNFLATKVILGTLFILVLPIIMNNVIYWFLSDIFTTVDSYITATDPGLSSGVSFVGLAAYLMEQLGLFSAMSIILSAISFRWVLSWIPFVGPK